MNTKQNYFLSQPHQPFFAMAVVNAVVFMLLFMLSYKGVVTLTLSPNLFHAFSLIFGLFSAAFLGFLLTTFPRFSQTPALEKSIYVTNFTLLAIGMFLFLLGSLFWYPLIFLGSFFVVASFAYTLTLFIQILKASPLPELHDQKWIIVGFVSGLLSSLLFFIGFISENDMLLSLAKLIGIYLFLTITALAVGQRMIPFFSHVMVEKNKKLMPLTYVLFTLYILAEIAGIKVGFIALLIAGVILAREIQSWKLPFRKSEPILWILHLAIFWLPLALILGSFASLAELLFDQNFIFVTLHLVVLGFVTTVLIGFGTRVTLGHSGNNMIIDKSTKILFYLTQIVVYFRAIYAFSGQSILFDISVTLWLVLFVMWGVKYLPVLVSGKRIN